MRTPSSTAQAGISRLLFFAALSVASTGALDAQTPGKGPMVLEVPANTRALSLGMAYFLAGDEPGLLFANPGLLPRTGGVQASAMAWRNESWAMNFAGTVEWAGGAIGVGVRVLEFSASSADPLVAAGDGRQLVEPGTTGAGQMAATLGYGTELGPIQVGVAAHLFRSRLGPKGSTGAAVDVGLATEIADVVLGLSAQNLGPKLEIAGEKVPTPQRFTLGATSPRAWVGPLDIAGSAAVTYRPDGEWIPGGGVEVAWWPVVGRTLVGRAGIRRVPDDLAQIWTVGAGFEGDRIRIEYTFQGYSDYDGAHHIGLRWQ